MDISVKKGILRGTVITSFGQVFTVLLLFLASMMLSRLMPEKELGTFFLMMAVWMFLEMFSSLGLDATLVKYLSTATEDKKKEIFSKLLILRFSYLVIISGIFLLISQFFVIIDPIINQYSFYIVFIFILDSLRSFYNAELQGRKKFKELIIILLTQSVLKILAYSFGAIFYELSIKYLIYTEIFALVLTFILQQFISSIRYKFNLNINFTEIKSILSFAFPLYLNNILAVFANRANSIIIAGYTNVVNVAYYEIGKKIPDGFSKLSTSIVTVYYPYISELFASNKLNDAKELIDRYIFYISLVTAPIILLVFFFSKEIIIIVFSSKYERSAIVLFLFVLNFYFSLVSNLIGYTLVAGGKPFLSFKINFIRTIIAIISSLIFVPIIGLVGAVYSILFAGIIGWFISIWKTKELSVHLNPIKYLYPLFLTIPFVIMPLTIRIISENFITLLILLILFLVLEYFIFEDFKNLFKLFYKKLNQIITKKNKSNKK